MRKSAKIALGFLAALTVLSLLSPWISPYSSESQNAGSLVMAPSAQHWFGTDALGRDLLSRILAGSRITLAVALFTALSGLGLGCLYGSVAALLGGWIDQAMMRVLDILYTLPTILLLIFLNVLFGEGLIGILVALSIEGWMTIARLVRGEVLRLKNLEFITAARAIGVRGAPLFMRHFLPNLIAPMLVALTLLIPTNIMYEAFLSFIGLGVRPPYTSWGSLANEGWRGLQGHPHLILFPGFAIFLTMLCFQVLGDTLKRHFDRRGGT